MGEIGGSIVIEVNLRPDKGLSSLDRLSATAQRIFNVTEHHADLAVQKSIFKQSCIKAENTVAKKICEDTRPFVPADTGAFDSQTMVSGNKVIYPGPNARFLYYGKVMVDPETESPFAPAGSTKVVTDKDLVFKTAVHGDAQAFWFRASKAMNLEEWKKTARRSIAHGGGRKLD